MTCQEKYFLCYILFTDQISLSNICIVIVCYQAGDLINFKTYLSFLIKPFSYTTRKIKIQQERKELLGEIKKYFSSFLKDFQLLEDVSDLRVCL